MGDLFFPFFHFFFGKMNLPISIGLILSAVVVTARMDKPGSEINNNVDKAAALTEEGDIMQPALDRHRLRDMDRDTKDTGYERSSKKHSATKNNQADEVAAKRELRAWKIAPPDYGSECSECSECERRRAKSLQNAKNGMTGMMIWKCKGDGSYSAMQCNASVGSCWCVDADGETIKDTYVFRRMEGATKPDCSIYGRTSE